MNGTTLPWRAVSVTLIGIVLFVQTDTAGHAVSPGEIHAAECHAPAFVPRLGPSPTTPGSFSTRPATVAAGVWTEAPLRTRSEILGLRPRALSPPAPWSHLEQGDELDTRTETHEE